MTISTRKRGRPQRIPPMRGLQMRIDPAIYAILAKHAAKTGKSKAAIVAGLIEGLNTTEQASPPATTTNERNH